jgi:integrase
LPISVNETILAYWRSAKSHYTREGLPTRELPTIRESLQEDVQVGGGRGVAPPSVYHGLQAVSGLMFGRTEARETEPVRPIPDLYVAAVLPFVTPHVAAMIKLQRPTGMRTGELVVMRSCDIDTTGEVWVYEPSDHKNRWRGHRKQVPQPRCDWMQCSCRSHCSARARTCW